MVPKPAQCNYPGKPAHPLTKTYWQVPEHGNICDDCHDEWIHKPTSKPIDATVAAPGPKPDPVRELQRLWNTVYYVRNRLDSKRSSSTPLTVAETHILAEVEDAISTIRDRFVCKRVACENRARYDSGYCGVCDILFNGAKGKRL